MSTLSDIKCPTPNCSNSREKYGDHYHRVYVCDQGPESFPTAIARCDSCGGYTDGQVWKHTCVQCGKEVEPGALRGLFVPHLCQECDTRKVAKEKASGQVCSLCHQVYSYCCC